MISLVDLTAQYHSIKQEIDEAVLSTLESGHFILGPAVSKFEESIASYLGVKHAIGLASGTDALVIALRVLNIGKGDEVIIPAYTFFATAGTVMAVGATPVFVDVDPQTYQIDTSKIQAAITSKTKAIIPVHLYGHPAEMNPILEIARKNGLKVIEDAAEMHGQRYRGRPCGSFGDISTLSFYANKHITTGEGGMILTDHDELAQRCRWLRNLCFGKEKRFVHEDLGWNFRMTNLQAAIGMAQLMRLDEFVARKRRMGKRYTNLLADLASLQARAAPCRR